MESLKQPDKMTVYMLMQQNGMTFTNSTICQVPSLGPGIFWKLEDAEMHRTFEYTKTTNTMGITFHIFELTVPNTTQRG